MRAHVQYCPDASLFYFCKFGTPIRDLGDFCVGFLKIQITVWIKKPYYHKHYAKMEKELKEEQGK